MWKRLAQRRLRALSRQFPAVLIVGARQVGKTTLARQTFPRHAYVDLEEPRTRERFAADPTFHLTEQAQRPVLLDEAQAVPAVFAALRGLIDRRPAAHGRFILLGSAQPALLRQVSESLAGRVGILELEPLVPAEIGVRSWRTAWLKGGFPRALQGDFREWWEAYLRTYVERDLPQLGVATDPLLLRRLLTMLAHAQGGIFNASAFAQSLGVSYHTVQRYVDVLEHTFLVRRLTPYHRNVRKRLVKAPKLYLRDTGLLHHLLNLSSLDEVAHHPVHGMSWETFVIEDLMRRERLAHPHTQFHYWRTAAGAEVDLVLDRGSTRVAVEVKVGEGGRPRHVTALEQSLTDLAARSAWVLDQAAGSQRLRPQVTRRCAAASFAWLPN
ncbi:MAG TPA: ATP-binding protein [Candidatus Acidoferrales bacterium]|nr:ATP-binding protein [Candidatus Acidoferrales bacterium]